MDPKKMSLKENAEMLIGTQVFVEDHTGDIFFGVLRRCVLDIDNVEVELSSAQQIPSESENSNYVYSPREGVQTMILKCSRMTGQANNKTITINDRRFRTDAKIAGNTNLNGGDDHFVGSDTELDLQEWEDDGCADDCVIELENGAVDELNSLGGWSVTEMFYANKDKCVGNGTVFDESEFSNVGIGEHSKEVIEKAQALAQQISMNPASRHNAQLENDDEERDLDVASKFNANENSQRRLKANEGLKQQGFDKSSKSAVKPIVVKNDEKYEKKMSTSEKKIIPSQKMTEDARKIVQHKKFENNEKKAQLVDVSPPPEPLPPQIPKAPTPLLNRKNSGGGRASVERAVSAQSSEQGDKGERKFKLDLNALPFVPSSKPTTKGTESTTNNNNVSSAPTSMMSGSLVVYNNNNNNVNTTTSTNNLATMATNFGNNFMANQVTTFVPVPAATLQQFQYAQIQHQPSIAQTQQPISHQPLQTHGVSRSPSVQPQQQIVQQTTLPATIHQPQQQHGFQQQQQVTGFYATTGTEAANLSATYVLNWQAATANNFGNNFMTNQVATFVPIPAATLQQFQYAQLQHQPPIPHQPPPSHTISRSSSVQPQQQHVQQQTNLQAVTVHQPQQQHGFQQQQMTGFYAATAAATNLSAYAQPLIQQTPYQPYFIAQNTSAAVPPHVTIPPPPMTHSIAYDSTHQIPPPGVFVNVPTQQGLNNGNMYSGAATVGHSQQNFQQQH